MKRLFFLLSLCTCLIADEPEFIINLRDPEYRDGVISTKEGGVITSPELRLQAREITYVNRVIDGKLVHTVVAEGDLMIDNGRRVFVGKRLEYNFADKTGIVTDGRTKIDVWFIGGEQIELAPNRTFYIRKAFVTTSENVDREWEVASRLVTITPDSMLKADKVTFRFRDTPLFYLPSYKSRLKRVDDPPVRYKVAWEKGMNPRFSMRYRVYSWKHTDLFWRFDYRLKEGPGTALEIDYASADKRRMFKTQNYLARDVFIRDDDPKKQRTRFRTSGVYNAITLNKKTTMHLRWDKFSDKNMPVNFKTDDFELGTAKRTEIIVRHFEKRYIAGLNARPRVNTFQGFKQELPQVDIAIHPVEIGRTGVISESHARVAYLDYVSADSVERRLPDFSAARIEGKSQLYRPIVYEGLTVTPQVGFIGIGYNDSPRSNDVGQAIFNYELDAQLRLGRSYPSVRHFVTPYAHYYGLTSPTTKVDNYYVFGIGDGYNRLNSVRVGMRNEFYIYAQPLFAPNFSADLYAYAFFGDGTFGKIFPKGYLDLVWNFPSVRLSSYLGWNFQEQSLDKANFAALWTINGDTAIYAEMRHRGKFDWRKNQYHNYILDVTRPIKELLDTPLSDGRNTFLTRLQLKLAPQWTAQFEGHFGWGRTKVKLKTYTSVKLNIITMIATSWQFKLSIGRTPRGVEFASSFDLIRK